MTEAEILDGVLQREGGYSDDPRDKGGPTKFGITAAVLGEWRKYGRQATREEVQALTEDEARRIYMRRYIVAPGFTVANVPFEPLRVQLIDFGINSGPARAIRWLQRVVGVPETSLIDERTTTALRTYPGRLINDALVAARVYMLDRATDSGAVSKAFEEGLESRALGFFLSRPEA